MPTEISWCDETWNPTVGCTRVSPGCENCYAEKVAHRGMSPQHRGLTVVGKQGVRWNGEINLVPSALPKPLHWRKPRKVFVDSMSDLFHPGVPFEYIAAVFGVMAACPQHIFQVLTKRPERMAEFFAWAEARSVVFNEPQGQYEERTEFDVTLEAAAEYMADSDLWSRALERSGLDQAYREFENWPLANVWLGVSVEDQQRADERIPLLLDCPAAVRFLSCEPLLGPVAIGLAGTMPKELTRSAHVPVSAWLHWVIVGGESGHGARPCDLRWMGSIVQECRDAHVAVFVKQLGSRPTLSDVKDRKGGDMSEWPDDLQVREFPDMRP